MKSFLAYCIFVLQVSEAAEAEQINTPVDPDGEVQLLYDLYGPARVFIAKLLRKSPYEGRT